MQTIAEELGELLPAPARDTSSFVESALAFLRERVGGSNTGLVVLVSATHPRATGERLGMDRAPGFKFFSSSRLEGRLFVVSNGLASAYAHDLHSAEVADAFALLVELGLGDRPALIADLAAGTGTWCPSGAEYDDSAVPVPLIESSPIDVQTSEAVVDQVDAFAASWQRDAGAYPNVWASEEAFIIALDAEKQLLDILYPLLRQRFRSTHRVHVEYNVVEGRSDLSLTALESPQPKLGRETCVLGVDVIGSFRAGPRGAPQPITLHRSDNERTIREGLVAADRYKAVTGSAVPVWYAFDMQQIDDDGQLVEDFQPAARQRNVVLRRCLVPNRARPAVAA